MIRWLMTFQEKIGVLYDISKYTLWIEFILWILKEDPIVIITVP